MDAKHTAGPWGAMKSETGPWAVFGENGNWLATTCKKQWPSEDKANARLIAAAPELLVALEQALEQAIFPGVTISDAYNNARAAVAKATGSQP